MSVRPDNDQGARDLAAVVFTVAATLKGIGAPGLPCGSARVVLERAAGGDFVSVFPDVAPTP